MTTPLVLTFVGDDRPGSRRTRSRRQSPPTARRGSRAGRRGSRASSPESCWSAHRRRGPSSALEFVAAPSLDAVRPAHRHRARRGGGNGKDRRGSSPSTFSAASARHGARRDAGAGPPGRHSRNLRAVSSEPFTGAEMFRAKARLTVPEGLELDDLRKALERLAAEIMVDVAVGESDPGS